MSDIKISIIMPVYKVEEYVGKAIESILAQTFTEFEFLIVDDGTPDRSGEICDRYAKKDHRIRVIIKKTESHQARETQPLISHRENMFIFWIRMTGQNHRCLRICTNLPRSIRHSLWSVDFILTLTADRIICQKKSVWTTGCLPMQKIFGKRHTGILTETCCIHRGINCTAWM